MPLRSSSLTPILVACCLGFLVVQLDVSVVNVGLGALKEAFGTDLTGLQWVINSYALIFSALLILGGACGDKWEPNPLSPQALQRSPWGLSVAAYPIA